MWKKGKKLRSSALAILLAASMIVGMVPGGMGEVQAADGKAKAEEDVGFFDKAKGFFSDLFDGKEEEVQPVAAFDEDSIVDADTSQGWQPLAQYTTENIGRIWTDKSVYNGNVTLPGIGEGPGISIEKQEDSDFMVGLSALSSTSNTSVTTQTPLDIALVLDVSGSMGDNMESYTYTPTYSVNTNGRTVYFVQTESGAYVEVDRITSGFIIQRFDHWEVNGETVLPKESPNDPDSTHIQFYTRRQTGSKEKLEALQEAANAFVDATAKQNEGIDEEQQHRISVVSFSDDGNVRRELTACNNRNAQSIKNTINGLRADGNTYPGNAMSSAQEAFRDARTTAQKVVIFFTDGNPAPAGTDDFNERMANDGVEGALELKNDETKIFSIGIFEGADPENTSTDGNNQFNAYMHAMSSNFPKATAWNELGERSTDGMDYYYAATSADELSEIFQKISQEINSGTGYPTQTQEGFENTSGYIKFHDQLGDYMQVDSFNTLVLDDKTFTANRTESEGKIQYTYSGDVDLNNDGTSENVSNIIITVTPGEGSKGDTVEVSIPATLLPLRNFNVDITDNKMSVEDKYPLRLFYNASLREEAKASLADPDQEMKNYIEANKDDSGGKVYFYSNEYTGNKPGPSEGTTLGDTVATFEPATGNTFYYFTEDTLLWVDEEMTEPLQRYNSNKEQYYYEKTYYEMNNGAPKEVKKAVSFRSHPQDEVREWVGTAENRQLYIKAGAPRLTRIDALTDEKENQVPGTATEVIAPNWDDETNQSNIEVSLGNNGRLEVELPGTLEIKKTVESEVPAPEKDFNFKLSLTNAEGVALDGEFDAQKFDALGNEVGEELKVQNGTEIKLKDGESVKVYGLSNGDQYKIEETDIPKGFTTEKDSIEGTIVGNEVTTAEFVNTYAVTPAVLEGDSSIQARKELTGRDWKEGDSFNFRLLALDGAPLPEGGDGISVDGNALNKEVTDDKAFSFGKMTFEKPGTYTYIIYEPKPGTDKELLGVSYSDALYRVDIDVKDDDEGALSATSIMTKRLDDQGQAIEGGEGTVVDDGIAVFTNTFEADSVSWGVTARKEYVDNSGAKPLEMGMFTFRVETIVNKDYQDKGPLPGGADQYDVKNGVGGQISFGQATFGTNHDGRTYLYKITEVVPEGVTDQNPTKDGMTYDTSEYYLKLSIGSKEDADGKTIMTVTPEYLNENMEVIPDMDEIVFKNEYTPEEVIIGGDDVNTAIEGTKTLTGREMKAGEFSFELSAANDAAIAGLNDDSIVFEGDTEKATMTANAPAAGNGKKASFNFGSVKFTKPGAYTFNMREVIPEPKAGGMTYDSHIEVVTVTVTDNNGVLTATTTYDNDGAAFENTYEASHNYSDDGGAIVTKTLNGRSMKEGEFNFTIVGTGDNAEAVEAADKKLEEADKAFKNNARRDGVANEMRKLRNVRFTEADAGQTFTYLIDEVMPKEADKAGGVTYDQSEFTLAIAVTDDGDGTMSTTTTVTRIKTADGQETSKVLGTYTNAESVVAVPFVNTYKAGSVTVDTSDAGAGARLRKVLEGRDWTADDEFTFTMTPQNGAPMPKENPDAGITEDENGNLQAVVTADAGTESGTPVNFGFGKITYDTAGTYAYTVKENVPEPKAGGMTYSENVVTITVTVTDPGTGALTANLTASGTVSGRRFINTYDASLNLGEAGGLAITKTLNGHNMAAEQFEFQIKAVGTDTATAEEAAELFGFNQGETEITFKNTEAAADGGTVTMKKTDVDFTSENLGKVYKYEVTEVDGKQAGYTYDNTVYTVEFWVTDDNSDGTLTLHTKVNDKEPVESSAKEPKETVLAFTNSYAATGTLGGETAIEVTKVLEGRDWIESDSFRFKLAAIGDTTVQAVKEGVVKLPDSELVIDGKDEDHKAAFGNITFTKPGTYTFAVSEVVPKDAVDNKLNGITYDTSVKNITVEVTDNHDGTLKTEVTEGSNDLTFTNKYAVSTVTLDTNDRIRVVKDLVGRDWTDADKFEFELTAKDGVPMPKEGERVVTATKDAKIQHFGTITYKKAGTYIYEITERVPEDKEPGMTYDTHKLTVTIVVKEDYAAGTLYVDDRSYAGNPSFTNIVGNNTKEVKAGDKNVNNGMIGVGDELTYVINWVNDGVDETGAPTNATVTITDKIPAGTEFVSAENGGKYENGTVTWTINAEAAATGSVSFKVVVTDKAGGTAIENQGEIKVGDNDPKVTNTVQTTVPGKDSAVEDGGELQVGSVLKYTISYKNPEAEAATVTITDKIPEGLDYVKDSAGENASYNEDDRILTWTLENVPAGKEGTVTFQARVNESAETKVENEATIQIGENNPEYKTDTDSKPVPEDGSLAISKTIKLTENQGTEVDTKKAFTFTVNLKDKADQNLTAEYAYTITKGEEKVSDGKVKNAGTILLKHGETATITGLPAGAKYTVTEKEETGYAASVGGEAGNVANGSIKAKEAAKADFTNTYSVTGSLNGSEKLTVTKEFTGREDNRWLESDKFTFKLEAADEATTKAVDAKLITLPKNAGNIEIVGDTEGHKTSFGDITFNVAGTYKFKVTENPSEIAGVTDDKDNVREVVVKVTDKGNGTLEAELTADSETLTFKNTYGAGTDDKDIAAQIEANKILHGRKMNEKEFNFEVVTRKTKDVEVFKEEVVAKGTNAGAEEDAKGKVTFAGASETASRPLRYTIATLNEAVADGYATKNIVDGKTAWTVNYTARELTDNLPKGVNADKKSFDFTIVVTDNQNGTLTAEVQYPENGIVFENSYATGGTDVDTNPTDANAYFAKALTGRDWLESDAFTFTIEPQNGAPEPEKTTVTVTSKEAKAEEAVPFGFGKIHFTDADMEGATANADGTLSKTFTYKIKENDIDAEKMPGVTKDGHTATLTITVTDNQKGELSATAGAVTVENGTFTNKYASSLDYNALGGLQITKVLHGRDMAEGQFAFTVTPEDDASAEKLGAKEFKNKAAKAETIDTIDVLEGASLTFSQADAGKTYTYTVAETEGTNKAYTYDTTPRTVTIEVTDNKNATLTVTTTVTKDGKVVDTQSVTTGKSGKKATVAFENTYNDEPATLGGEGNVTINATKSLTNRPMENGEFTFKVLDKKGDKVTTGTNNADGAITFDTVKYTTDKLMDDVKSGIATVDKSNAPTHVYTYEYTVVEAPTTDGVTGITTSFAITVNVTDDGNGKLAIEVVYPEGKESLPFENAYGTSAEAEVNVNGQKNYKTESGDNAPDITGKYTFTIEGSEGAPMPEKTEAKNDAAGNVDFGKTLFTMENVFGKDEVTEVPETEDVTEETESTNEAASAAEADSETTEADVEAAGAVTADAEDEIMPIKSPERTKTFTYTVKESGNVAGVDNDPKATKTFTVHVTDNGDGTISIEKSWEEFAFEFTNTYRVNPVDYDINTDLSIKKELTGREMKEGEFTFELVNADNKVVATATNKADGTVAFDKELNYKEPDAYNYVIREQKGTAGGVQYDSAEHTVTVVVTDNGDGTLSAKAETKSKGEIVFKNIYETTPASATLGASKVYEGNELKDEQFTFELKDKDGKVVSEAKNMANGQVAFETITYDEAGTYEYTISEKNDKQKNVTYDEAVYNVTVTVTDNGEGSLLAEVAYADGKAPVFTNKYTKPVEPKPEDPKKPQKPAEPQKPASPKTGDEAPIVGFITLMVIALAAITVICIMFFKKRRRG